MVFALILAVGTLPGILIRYTSGLLRGNLLRDQSMDANLVRSVDFQTGPWILEDVDRAIQTEESAADGLLGQATTVTIVALAGGRHVVLNEQT